MSRSLLDSRFLDQPDCFYSKTCRAINISNQVPLDWAIPLYGYWMPIIVSLTLATNSFIVIVLSHKYLKTPTNFVLLAMAVSELFTGISCIPWFLYYFTLGGYQAEALHGLPQFWCKVSPYVAALFPSIFHSTAIWLTVYLAIQRYIYICVPSLVRRFCTIRRSKQVTLIICLLSFVIYSTELLANYQFTKVVFDTVTNTTRRNCYRQRTNILQHVGNSYYKLLYTGQCTIVHLVPCVLLVIFTWKLVKAIQTADKRHAYLLSKSMKRRTIESVDGPVSETSTHRLSRLLKPRESISEPKRVQGLKQNTRMLVVVILIFLVTEIPAAVIFIIHVLSVSLSIHIINYKLLNILLIVRNVLIVSSYPFRFAIYCGMSQQFRDVVRQMFTGKMLPHLIRDKDNSTTMALVQTTLTDRDSEEKRHSMLSVSPNGRPRTSLTRYSLTPKTNEKAVQCNHLVPESTVPFDPYLADLNFLVEVGEDDFQVDEQHNKRDASTQCELRLDTIFMTKSNSLLSKALKEQTMASCHVMLANGS